jgi:acyl-CoA reductase-like NAD-dependent aldehyde dehydrogenase
MTIESINPATGQRLETYAEMPRAAVDDIIGKAHEAFLTWRRTSLEERARRMRGAGAYYPPTVLTEVSAGMPAYEEELFGPVAAVIPVKDEAEAIATANDSVFGLGAAVITRDVARGEHIAADLIESGCVFVNESVRSDPRLPFGGVKESGYGRELSTYGIKEFVNIKTVYVASAQGQASSAKRTVGQSAR